jgi:4-hydroxy-3-methylbut-2-enyl diphosphate reductase IspH
MPTKFYYFTRDGRCKWAKEQIARQIPYVLKMKLSKTPYYVIVDWNSIDGKGIQKEYLAKKGIPYVNSIEELPQGAGVAVSAYDGDPLEIKQLKEKGVPIYEQVCPWIKKLREIFLNKIEGYQYVFLCEEDHMIAVNYRSIFPKGTLLVNPDNYKEKMCGLNPNRPIYFIVYAAFRVKDSQQVIQYIKDNYNHPDNIYYTETICQWAGGKNSVFEEISEAYRNINMDEVWVINSSEDNTSVKSLIRELTETGLKYRLIKRIQDIEQIDNNFLQCKTIGVLRAPNPYYLEEDILSYIKNLDKRLNHKGTLQFIKEIFR